MEFERQIEQIYIQICNIDTHILWVALSFARICNKFKYFDIARRESEKRKTEEGGESEKEFCSNEF